jgi:hypothetical protein
MERKKKYLKYIRFLKSKVWSMKIKKKRSITFEWKQIAWI